MKDMAEDKEQDEQAIINKKIKRRNFISFGSFFLLSGAAYEGWRALYRSPDEVAGITAGTRKPLRRALNQTELFFKRIFSDNHLVKIYPASMAVKNVRHNGDIGVQGKFDPLTWKLQVVKSTGEKLYITLDEIKALPKTDIVFDFKCVEGWDQIQHWGGVKLVDFIKHYQLDYETKLDYVGLETPDKEYYVGLDMPSALHPQTILAYEMNGKPLPLNHGYPLRLIIPVKYGIKNLKRVGTITFSNQRPHDYWAEQGYDYYSGL
jgi:DMSO/TMAO reductase YedYZ molybdopterin-dependent catalytic subunit